MGRSLAQDKIAAIKGAMMQLDKNLVSETEIIGKQIAHEQESKSVGNVEEQKKSIGDLKKKMTNILTDVTKLEDMQKDLNDANIGDDVQEAKAISLVQNDDQFNTIKTNLKKAIADGDQNIASYAEF
jgi:hypothetical protein